MRVVDASRSIVLMDHGDIVRLDPAHRESQGVIDLELVQGLNRRVARHIAIVLKVG